jgi:hypothetical protein
MLPAAAALSMKNTSPMRTFGVYVGPQPAVAIASYV